MTVLFFTQARYREGLPLVLSGLSFSVQPKEKIGIVGRTGAGKSSLAVILYRLVNVESGSVSIAGVNINDLGEEYFSSMYDM